MFPGLGEDIGFGESASFSNSKMHPDSVGAIIGISLAGSVLIVALLFLCVLQFCCRDDFKGTGGGNRNANRTSTSSRFPFANFGFGGSSRDVQVRTLSAADLHQQNLRNWNSQLNLNSTTGILNPVWQLHCHTCGVLAPPGSSVTQQQPCRVHSNQVSITSSNPCLFCAQEGHDFPRQTQQEGIAHMDGSSVSYSGFQYFTPQLFTPSESPPPYPGMNERSAREAHRVADGSGNQVASSEPPPYSPKH